MHIPQKDRDILRRLGEQVLEIAGEPVNAVRRGCHAAVDQLMQGKPTIHIYQVPWHEMDVEGELQLQAESPFGRDMEDGLRKLIYQWRHMPGDMVMEAAIHQPMAIHDSGFGIGEKVEVARVDPRSDVVSRHFIVQIAGEEDIERIRLPEVWPEPDRTDKEYGVRCGIFEGILPVRKTGVDSFWFAPWDEIVRLTGVQEILTDMVLRPDYVNAIMDRYVTAWLHRLDQYERLGLLTGPAMGLWGIGAAQIFSEVSPAMHEEFALKHEARWYSRFGMNYYGCCEPLDNKVDICLRHIPRLRKISMSPWVDFERACRNVGDGLIFAWKPNPAVLAAEAWDPDSVRRDMREKLAMARRYGCIVEIHMKDISTVRYQPHRLWEWARIAAEVTEEIAG